MLMNMNQAAIWSSIEAGSAGDCKAEAIPSELAKGCRDMVRHPATGRDAQASYIRVPSCRHLEAQLRTN